MPPDPPVAKPPLQLPQALPEAGLMVGWSLEPDRRSAPIGFRIGDRRQSAAHGYQDPILLVGEGHLMTIAPTGAGKGVSCIVPALLRHPGPMIVIDPKGENVAIAARRRREMGQIVHVLDPFRITGVESDALNPMALLDPDSLTLVDDIVALASLLLPESVSERDQFWSGRAREAMIAMMLFQTLREPQGERNFMAVRVRLGKGAEEITALIKKMRSAKERELNVMASALDIAAPETWSGILAFALEHLDFARGPLVRRTIAKHTIDLEAVTRGDPMTIFIVIPPAKLHSHAKLLRVWIGTLMTALMRRRFRPPLPTLFVLDEAAQLGPLPQLRQAITLLRGYGLQTWSFWQDVSQLQRLYPLDWPTMVNNSKVLQAFGSNNLMASRAVTDLTGFADAQAILDLDADEMLLQIGGDEAVIAQRPNYLTDPAFQGLFDANPFYGAAPPPLPEARRPQRVFVRPEPQPEIDNLKLLQRLMKRAEAAKPDADPTNDDGTE